MGVDVKAVGSGMGRVRSVRRLKGGMMVFWNEVCHFELGLLTATEINW